MKGAKAGSGSTGPKAALTRRSLLGSAAVTAGAAGVFGTSAPRRAAAQTTKTVRYWTTQSAPEQRAFYANMVKKAAEIHPDITVVVEYVSDNDVRPKLAAAMAGGDPPQIVSNLGITAAAPLAAAGLVEPMDEAMKMVGKDKFEANALNLFEAITGHDDAMALSNTSVGVFWYRQDMFDEAGLKVPVYWDEFLAAAKKLTRNGIYGACLPYGKVGMSTDTLALLMHNGGGYMLAPDNSITFNSEATVAALEFMKEMRQYCPPGANSYSYGETLNAFVSGASATGIYTGRVLANVAAQNPSIDSQIRNAPYPYRREGGRSWHPAGFPSQFIPKGAKNVAEANKIAALQYRPDVYTPFLLGAPGQNIPVVVGVGASPEFLSHPILTRHKNEVATLVEICGKANAFVKPSAQHPLNAKAGAVWGSWIFGDIVQKVVIENMPAKQAAAWGQDQIAAILKAA
jgi:multiple sugar transport system substrate-binding protein